MSRRRKSGGGGGHGSDERWLLTYADMITLLLALFILLFAMSSIDAKKFDAVRRSLSDSFHGPVLEEQTSVIGGGQAPLDPSNANMSQSTSVTAQISQAHAAQGRAMEQQVQDVTRSLRASGLRVNDPKRGDVQVAITERGVVVRLAGDTFFDSGSAAVRPSLEHTLRGLASELKHQRRPLAIEGHTDGQPLTGGGQFADNMELSSGRALAVYHLLSTLGVANMHVGGYGDTRPLVVPAHPTDSMPQNRRVEIVIMSSGADKILPGAGAGGAAIDASGNRDAAASAAGMPSPPNMGSGPQYSATQIIDPITILSAP